MQLHEVSKTPQVIDLRGFCVSRNYLGSSTLSITWITPFDW